MSNMEGTDYFEYDLYSAAIEGNYFERYFHRKRIQEIYDLIDFDLLKGLDYGCGTGAVLIPLAMNGVDIDGYDISEKNIDRCRNYILENELTIKVFNSVPNNKYDVILLINVIEYVIDKVALINNVSSLLNNNGLLLVAIANPRHPFIFLRSLRVLFSGRSKNDIIRAEPISPISAEKFEGLMNKFFTGKLKKYYYGLLKINKYLLYVKYE